MFSHFAIAFFAMAAIVLAVTGAEALYADMGHFGRAPITRAWLLLVFPALHAQLHRPGRADPRRPAQSINNPFFLLVPDWGQIPMVILATTATVIASQAVITGAFSVAHQAVQLGYLPRLRIAHTSAESIGQIYVPWINWLLMVSVLTLVVRLPDLGRARLRVRHGRHRHDHDHHAAVLLRRPPPVATAALDGGARRRRAARRRPAVPRREPDEDRPRRLAAAADRRRRVHDPDHLAARPGARHRSSASRTRVRCGRSSTSCTSMGRRCRRVPGTAVFLNRGKDDRRRWRCAPASSTCTCCTSTS